MAVTIIDPFDPQMPFPLDLRHFKQNTSQRDAIPTNSRHEGMPCYVQSDQIWYYLKGGIANSNWEPLVSSGTPVGLQNVYFNSSAPNSNQGADGDIWFRPISGATELYQKVSGIWTKLGQWSSGGGGGGGQDLQSVTENGNVTDKGIYISDNAVAFTPQRLGLDIYSEETDSGVSGQTRIQRSNSIGAADINQITLSDDYGISLYSKIDDGNEPIVSLIVSPYDGVILQATDVGPSYDYKLTIDAGGIVANAPVKGEDAIHPKEFVTKQQLDAVAGGGGISNIERLFIDANIEEYIVSKFDPSKLSSEYQVGIQVSIKGDVTYPTDSPWVDDILFFSFASTEGGDIISGLGTAGYMGVPEGESPPSPYPNYNYSYESVVTLVATHNNSNLSINSYTKIYSNDGIELYRTSDINILSGVPKSVLVSSSGNITFTITNLLGNHCFVTIDKIYPSGYSGGSGTSMWIATADLSYNGFSQEYMGIETDANLIIGLVHNADGDGNLYFVVNTKSGSASAEFTLSGGGYSMTTSDEVVVYRNFIQTLSTSKFIVYPEMFDQLSLNGTLWIRLDGTDTYKAEFFFTGNKSVTTLKVEKIEDNTTPIRDSYN